MTTVAGGDEQAGGLRIGVLGPLRVMRDGVEITPGPAGQRAVLAMAALGLLERRQEAIDVLWEGEPPDTAVAVVQTYVSRLRSLLGPARDGGRVLVRAGPGYRLRAGEDELDLHVFQRLAGVARRAREVGGTAAAGGAYEQALALWRGDPVADVDTLQTHPAVTALAAERVAVTLEYVDLALESGWHDKALRHLRELAAAYPLDEVLHARLMLALASSGRQAEALRLHEDLRHRLDDQLGVSPGPELRAAHAKVLRQEVPPAGSSSAWRPVFQLPATLADFTGRAAERGRLIDAITLGADQPGVPVVVICGAPGVGKTSLALRAAHEVRARFPDGQLWVHLAGTSASPRDPTDVLGEFLRAFGVPGPAIPDDPSERASCYRSRLAGRRVLVVADDAASAAQVRPLLPGTAGCAVLVTSRVQLEGLAGAMLIPLEIMTQDESAGLLARIAGPDRVAAEPVATSELVKACGALPLALRIAGGKLAARPAWPVSAVLRRLTREHDRLSELEAGDLSVRAGIASSYQLLPSTARRVFRLLGLLGPSDFAEWVPGVLLGKPDRSAGEVDELVRRSLLTPVSTDPGAQPRYRLHDLVRDYAAERLCDETAAEREAATARALGAWLQLASLAGERLPSEPDLPPLPACPHIDVLPAEVARNLTADPVAWLVAERDNLRAAVGSACETGRSALASHLAASLYSHRDLRDPRDEELLWRHISHAAHRAGDAAGAADASLRSATATVRRGYSADAAPLLDACIQRFQDAGAPFHLSFALYYRAGCAWDLQDYETAWRKADQGRMMARQAGLCHAELFNVQMLGLSLVYAGQHEAGVAACEQALSMAGEMGLWPGVALHSLADACRVAGQNQRALSLAADLLDLANEANDAGAQVRARMIMGDAHHQLGLFQDAVDAFAQAQPFFRAQHDTRWLAKCLLKQAYAYEAMGSAEAIPLFEQSLQIFRELHLPHKAEETRQALERCRA